MLARLERLEADRGRLERLEADHTRLKSAVQWLARPRGILLGYELIEQFENLHSHKASTQGPSTTTELRTIFEDREDLKELVLDGVRACADMGELSEQSFLEQVISAKQTRNGMSGSAIRRLSYTRHIADKVKSHVNAKASLTGA